jgi:predicted RNA-binding protein with RPS1 domain
MPERDWPEEGELVVCTVDAVKDFVAFVRLDEYGGRQGLIPISEIAKGWVKYIRDHIREGQKVVCKVLHVDRSRGHIDLSLKDVNEHQRREKIQEWKNEQKAHKWIGFVAEESKVPAKAIEDAIKKDYTRLYRAFEDAVIEGEKAFAKSGIHEARRSERHPEGPQGRAHEDRERGHRASLRRRTHLPDQGHRPGLQAGREGHREVGHGRHPGDGEVRGRREVRTQAEGRLIP